MSKEVRIGRTGRVALVDDEDYDRLAAIPWQVFRDKYHRTEYAKCTSGPLKSKFMHRIILGLPSYAIDHRDGNGLNNQRHNLRCATNQQNQFNASLRRDSSTGFKGVHKRENGRFTARVRVSGRLISAGVFDTPEEAARAYDRKALEVGGEYARLNFPKEQYE